MVVKRKPTKHRVAKRKPTTRAKRKTPKRGTKTKTVFRKGSEDDKSIRKYERGGRIEAYTWGDAMRDPKWPF